MRADRGMTFEAATGQTDRHAALQPLTDPANERIGQLIGGDLRAQRQDMEAVRPLCCRACPA